MENIAQKYKQLSSLNEFESKIQMWVPNSCTCRLCKRYVQDVGFI